MAVSLLMPAWAVNVRVTTCVCAQRCAEIVTERKAAGSRCSAGVRAGSQAASAPTAMRIILPESRTSVTPNSATSMPGSGAGRTALPVAPGVIVPICLSGVCASSPAQADSGCAGASRVRWTRTQPACTGGGGLFSGGGSLARCTVLVPGGGLSSLTSRRTSACALSRNPPAEAVAGCGELTATVAGAAAELQPASSTRHRRGGGKPCSHRCCLLYPLQG